MKPVNFTEPQINRLKAAWWLLDQVLPHRADHTDAVASQIRYHATACGIPARGCIWSPYGPQVIVMQQDPLRLRLAEVSQFFSHEGRHVGFGPDGRPVVVEHDCHPSFCEDARELAALEAYAEEHAQYIRERFGEDIGDGVPVVEKVLKVAVPIAAGAAAGALLGIALNALFGNDE
jgi:hypothetical protein